MHKYKVLFYIGWRLIAGCSIETYDRDSAEKLATAKMQDKIKEIEDALNAKVNRTFVSQLPDNQHRKGKIMTQKELRKKYMQIIKTEAYPHNAEIQEYCKKRCGYIVELTDGKIIRLCKPRKNIPVDFSDIIDRIVSLNNCLEGRKICKTIVEYDTSPDDCDLVYDLIFTVEETPKWLDDKAARMQDRNSEDIQRIIDGYKYLLMKYKVGGKK